MGLKIIISDEIYLFIYSVFMFGFYWLSVLYFIDELDIFLNLGLYLKLYDLFKYGG